MKYTRTLFVVIALAFASLGVGCTTTPDEKPKEEPKPLVTMPRTSDATLDFVAKLAKLEMENQNLRMVGMLKFAEDSGSDFVKGFIAAQLGVSGGAQSGGSSASGAIQTLMRTAVDMRKLEYAAESDKREHDGRYGLGARALQWGELGLSYLGLRFGYRERMRRIDSEDTRYALTLDTMRYTQAAGYQFGSSLFNAYDNRIGGLVSRIPVGTPTEETPPAE